MERLGEKAGFLETALSSRLFIKKRLIVILHIKPADLGPGCKVS